MHAPLPTATQIDPAGLHLPPTQPIDITHLLTPCRTDDGTSV